MTLLAQQVQDLSGERIKRLEPGGQKQDFDAMEHECADAQ
jgi:hypothetical protein